MPSLTPTSKTRRPRLALHVGCSAVACHSAFGFFGHSRLPFDGGFQCGDFAAPLALGARSAPLIRLPNKCHRFVTSQRKTVESDLAMFTRRAFFLTAAAALLCHCAQSTPSNGEGISPQSGRGRIS